MAYENQQKPATEGDEDSNSEQRQGKLRALAITIAVERSQAMEGRELSGIEKEWKEDEEFYEGIDAYNRGEMGSWSGKPLGQAAVQDRQQIGSTIFLNICRPYCDSASAKLGETLMPTDDRAWEIDHTPVPELLSISKNKLPIAVKDGLENRFPGDPVAQNTEIDSLVTQALDEIDQAKEIADMQTKVIDDWHIECQYHAENRIVFDDVTKAGSGVLKGPFQVMKKMMAYVDGKLIVKERLQPASKRISYWNLYPDPGCGQNIHQGSFIFERDDIGVKALYALSLLPNYEKEQILEAIKEGPHRATKESPKENEPDTHGLKKRDTKHLFEIWYWHGLMKKEDLDLMNCPCPGDKPFYDAKVSMVNNRIIRAVLNPLETGDFPYDIMVWQRREGIPWGMGIARQIRTCQRMVNAAARNMMNNAGVAGGPQLVVQEGVVEPENGIYEITPLKIWIAGEQAITAGLDQAFRFVEVPMLQDKLEAIINLGLRMAEITTGMPLIMQGHMGSAPDRVGVINILDNNGSTVMRRIARLYDDLITEPHLRRYHRYILEHHEDDSLKAGDFNIDARGSSALVEKAQKNQALIEVAKMGLQNDPRNKIDPVKFANELLRSLRLDPKTFHFDDDEWESMVGEWDKILEAQKSAGDSTTMIAQLKAEIDAMRISSLERIADKKIELEGATVVAKIDLERELSEAADQLTLMLAGVDENMDAMGLEGDMKKSADKIKADLAREIMKIQATLRLVRAEASAARLPTPPVEPPGKAPKGESFTK